MRYVDEQGKTLLSNSGVGDGIESWNVDPANYNVEEQMGTINQQPWTAQP